jgi:hypothetical protein
MMRMDGAQVSPDFVHLCPASQNFVGALLQSLKIVEDCGMWNAECLYLGLR